MDVLKPETYWIGGRCYRKNPSKNGGRNFIRDVQDSLLKSQSRAETSWPLGPYVEEDEILCDPDAPEESEDLQEYVVESTESGFRSKFDTIPSTLFPHIIGSKGTTKKRIEYETNTRIVVPRPNEKGDIIVRGQKEKDVRNARRRLELIASQARKKRDATHFACFPLNHPQVIDNMKSFKEQVMKECNMYSRGLDERLFTQPEKLHLTLCVMILFDERERNKAGDILKSLENQIKSEITQGAQVQVHLKGLEIMNDDPTQVDVLYVKCHPQNNHLQRIADLIAKSFIESGFAKENRGENVKLHCTVMNTLKLAQRKEPNLDNNEGGGGSDNRNKDRKGNQQYSRDTFDASLILSKFKDFDFGMVQIQNIKLATRHTTGSDGSYKSYSSILV